MSSSWSTDGEFEIAASILTIREYHNTEGLAIHSEISKMSQA